MNLSRSEVCILPRGIDTFHSVETASLRAQPKSNYPPTFLEFPHLLLGHCERGGILARSLFREVCTVIHS